MEMAALMLVVVPVLLVLAAGELAVAVIGLRSPARTLPGRRVAAMLLLAAGIGTLLCAVLALSALWTGVPYGIVLLLAGASVLAVAWNVLTLGSALLTRVLAPRLR